MVELGLVDRVASMLKMLMRITLPEALNGDPSPADGVRPWDPSAKRSVLGVSLALLGPVGGRWVAVPAVLVSGLTRSRSFRSPRKPKIAGIVVALGVAKTSPVLASGVRPRDPSAKRGVLGMSLVLLEPIGPRWVAVTAVVVSGLARPDAVRTS